MNTDALDCKIEEPTEPQIKALIDLGKTPEFVKVSIYLNGKWIGGRPNDRG